MAITASIDPKSVVWNGTTWDSSGGGTLNVRYTHEASEREVRTGDDQWSACVFTVDKTCRVYVTLVDVKQTPAIGAKSDMTITLTTKSGTSVIVIEGCILLGINGSQPRGIPGEVELSFIVEADDAKTAPIT